MKKFLSIILVVLALLLAASGAAARPRAGCVVELAVFRGLHGQVGGLRVFVDTDQAWSETSEDAPTLLAFDVNPGWTHIVNIVQPGHGVVWSMGYRCINPGVTPIEAFLIEPLDW